MHQSRSRQRRTHLCPIYTISEFEFFLLIYLLFIYFNIDGETMWF